MRSSGPLRRVQQDDYQPLRLVSDESEAVLPPNPWIPDGIKLLYLGVNRRRVEGEATGFVYHADPARREIEVAREDLPSVLRNRAFVLAY